MTVAPLAGELLPAAGGGLAVADEIRAALVDVAGDARIRRLVADWLFAVARDSRHTRAAYVGDIRLWLDFCDRAGIDPLQARKAHTDAWIAYLQGTPSPRTGRRPKPATVARRVATVASWYTYLLDEDHVAAVPVRKQGRPQAPRESPTVGLSRDEVTALLRRLRIESVRDRAVVRALVYQGLRADELAGLDVGDVRWQTGRVTWTVRGKGGRERTTALYAPVVEAVDELLCERAAAAGVDAGDLPQDAPLFERVGGGRYTDGQLARIVRRVARAAGVRSWADLSPHSLRHTCVTMLLDAGAPVADVADLVGHLSLETTQRYDRARGSLARSARTVHALGAWIDPDG